MAGAFDSADGFDLAVARLSIALGMAAGKHLSDAASVFALEVPDLTALDDAHRTIWLSAALEHVRRKLSPIPDEAARCFGRWGPEVFREAKRDLKARYALIISPTSTNTVDSRLLELVIRSQTNFVRNSLGVRMKTLGEKARQVVSSGLESGLGRKEVARNLAGMAHAELVGRATSYWDVVAGAFIGSGRSASQMSAYAEAGIHRYVIEAVLDEHTTEICRFLHGKTFRVEDALSRLERAAALEDPMEIKSLQPWVRDGTSDKDGHRWLYAGQGSERKPVVEVLRGGFGSRDVRGEYGRCLSDRQLADLGVSLPPFHGLCRTTTVPGD